jgi:hypothetical protein
MDEQIDQVIAEDGQCAEAVIEGKGEEADVAAAGQIEEVGEVFEIGVFHKVGHIIKMEGSVESVGVDEGGQQYEKE